MKKNINVLIVSSKFPKEYSGSGLRAYNTYKRLEKKYNVNWDVVCNSTSHTGNTIYYYEDKKVYRIASLLKVKSNYKVIRKLLIVFSMIWETIFSLSFLFKNAYKYDLVHTFGNTWSIGVFSLYFSIKRKPVIRELVTDLKEPFFPIQIKGLIGKIFKKNNSRIVAISKKLEMISKDNGAVNIWQRPNPIEEKKFFIEYDKKYYYRKNNSKFLESDILLCYIGSLRKSKNHIFLLEVLKQLPVHFKLVLAGPENKSELNIYSQLLEKVTELGLENRVQLEKKFIENIDEYIKMCDVYLFPSISEGLGTPVLEAQACGVPVVSNFLENITSSEIIEGQGGYCSKLDVNEFTLKIESALSISQSKLLENADFIKNRASTEIIDLGYYTMLRELLNEN